MASLRASGGGDNPADRISAAILDVAHGEGALMAVRHACDACASAMGTGAVGLYVDGALGVLEPVHATDPVSGHLVDSQVVVGEGPATDVLATGAPVLAPDLADSLARWPAFAPAALEAGVSAVFAFPLVMGTVLVGALEIHRADKGGLSIDEVADALWFADATTLMLLDSDQYDGPTEDPDWFGVAWAVVHQAVGKVSVQLHADLTEAFARMRAHTYLAGISLSEVAGDVIANRLRFTPDVGGNWIR